MENKRLQTWMKYCSNAGMTFEISAELQGIVNTLGRKAELFRNVILSFINDESSFSFNPQVGAKMDFTFDEDNVKIERLNKEVNLSRREFLDLMASIDAIFIPTYALGTVLELDTDLLDKNQKEEFPNIDNIYLVVVGQKIPSGSGYIDYLCSYYPNGLRDQDSIVPVQNHMIKKVIAQGPDTPLGMQYIKYLKDGIVQNGQKSVSYLAWESEDD